MKRAKLKWPSRARFHMQSGHSMRRRMFVFAICVFINGGVLTAVQGPLAASDDYLRMLRQEAKTGGAKVDNIGNQKAKTQNLTTAEPARGEMKHKDFEVKLERDHPSTFTLYKKLKDKQRKEVFAAYQRNGSFDQVTRKVLKLLYGI